MAQSSGAYDLSTVAASAAPAASGAYATDVTEATFEATMRKSLSYPVVLELYSSKAPESAAMGETLTQLANEAGGTWLLARLNVDESPKIVQALQVRAVPTIMGVVGGQLVPLWQGSMPKEDAAKVIAEVLKMAAGNGIMGKVEPQTPAGASEPEDDPRYAGAYDAMGEGDYARAEQEFGKLLAQNPADAQAKVGKAQAGLLARVSSLNPALVTAAVGADGAPIQAIMDAADLEIASGQVAEGFARLTTAIADHYGDERETLRVRLLELFDTQDPADKVVLTARRNLTTALF